MAKFLTTQHTFSNGVLNPRMEGRTDIKEYFQSCKEITNAVVTGEGTINQFRGNLWLKLKNGDEHFDFSIQEKFLFGIRGSNVHFVEVKSIGDVTIYLETKIFTESLPANISSFEYGSHITVGNISIVTDKNGVVEPLVLYQSSTWNVVTLSDYAALVGGLNITENRRRVLSRPLSPYNTNAGKTITVGGASTILTSTGFEIGQLGSEGSYVEVSTGSVFVYYRIDSIVSPTIVNVTRISGFGISDISYNIFRTQEWYDNNWPRVISFYQGRLIFANTPTNIDTVWNSRSGNIVEFANDIHDFISSGAALPAPNDSDPFILQPSTNEITPIKWILAERFVTMGTSTEEYIISGVDGIYADATTTIRSVSKYGSSDVGLAFRAQASTYFVERGGSILREMTYSDENGGYTSRNIGILGPELVDITKIVYDYHSKRAYVEDSNGIHILAMDNASGVLAWSSLDVSTEGIAGLIDSPHGMMLVANGVTAASAMLFYTEGIFARASGDQPVGTMLGTVVDAYDNVDFRLLSDYVFPTIADQTLLAYNPEDKTWNETLTKIASGHPLFTDGDLYITPGFFTEVVSKEAGPSMRVETSPIQQGSPIGDAQLAFQRVDKVGLRLYKTGRGLTIGTTETTMEEVELDEVFTGIKDISVDGSPENDHTIIIENSSPVPVVLLSISARGQTEEG